jgi:hypothetical protein
MIMGLLADGGTAEAMVGGAINEADKKTPVMVFFAQFIFAALLHPARRALGIVPIEASVVV